MSEYKRILFASDFVPEDDKPVAEKALKLAKVFNAELTVLHVIEENYYHPGLYMTKNNIEEYERNIMESAQEYLQKIGEELSIPHERQILVTGKTKNLILKTAKDIKADLIILGSHGRHGLSLLLMGSTANGILHGAHCDVLAVRVQNSKAMNSIEELNAMLTR